MTAGYSGYAIAAGCPVSRGREFSSLALIAGALGLGIGLGLQPSSPILFRA